MLIGFKAPITQAIDITYKEIKFDGRFVKNNVYRKPAPDPNVDKAWTDLGVGCQSAEFSL